MPNIGPERVLKSKYSLKSSVNPSEIRKILLPLKRISKLKSPKFETITFNALAQDQARQVILNIFNGPGDTKPVNRLYLKFNGRDISEHFEIEGFDEIEEIGEVREKV